MHDIARFGFVASSVVLAFAVPLAHAEGPTGLLNDTGQAQCYDGNATTSCTPANTGNAADYPRQDARFGRDAAAAAGQLTKIGSGAAGFDFSRICWTGDAQGSGACTGTLVANTGASANGPAAGDWACTRDNHTNLIWSLQSAGDLDWNQAASTGAGSLIGAHNASARCGFSAGWRVPTRRELLSIVDHGTVNPAIDSGYFQSTQALIYWTNDPFVSIADTAWWVEFKYGESREQIKTVTYQVRLVHSGQ